MSNDVETAFAEGRLWIQVDPEQRLNPHLWFVEPPPKWDGTGSLVHVLSKHAGGEIRGYILIAGRLHTRLPQYAGPWPELDSAVVARTNAPKGVTPWPAE